MSIAYIVAGIFLMLSGLSMFIFTKWWAMHWAPKGAGAPWNRKNGEIDYSYKYLGINNLVWLTRILGAILIIAGIVISFR